MLVLFVCMAVAVVIQTLSVAVLCAEQATSDEAIGRARLEEKDQGLVALRQRALCVWEPVPWTIVREGEGAVEGSLSDLEDGAGWVMSGVTRQGPTISRLTTSAWLERGRDGIDLPLAALVADAVAIDPGRDIPWLEVDMAATEGEDGEATPAAGSDAVNTGAVAYVATTPEDCMLGDGCCLVPLSARWRLEPGWLALLSAAEVESQAQDLAEAFAAGDGAPGLLPAAAPSPQMLLLEGRPGRTVSLPEQDGVSSGDGWESSCREFPILVLLRGGATLDARNLGDFFGVIVVDDGSLLLDGTTIHGAVFVTKEVSLGQTGRLLFSREILRWATDRSLQRARLVPGTRWEGTE